jgi:hypothetical protein
MQTKQKSFSSVYIGRRAAEEKFKDVPDEYDYGPMNLLPQFTMTHPAVMRKKISEISWKDKLRATNPPGFVSRQVPHKHEKLKNRILTNIEQVTGLDFNHKNWKKLLKV